MCSSTFTPFRGRSGVVVRPPRGRAGAAGGRRLAASELLDRRVDLADIWGEAAVARLVDCLAEADDPAAAASVLDRAVAGRAHTAGTPDPMVDALVDLLRRQPA
jgi:hypothetical protein